MTPAVWEALPATPAPGAPHRLGGRGPTQTPGAEMTARLRAGQQ